MTDKLHPDPPRPTLDDLDPEMATIDALVAMVRSHREGQEYPTGEQLLGNLPKVLRALRDHGGVSITAHVLGRSRAAG